MSELDIPKLPPDALELLNDPQLSDLRPRAPGLPKAGKTITPSQPPTAGESPFVIFRTDFEHVRDANVVWSNAPSARGPLGRGRGFPALRNTRPSFTEDQPKPSQSRGAWRHSGWLIASPRFATVIRAFDPGAVETVEIDWIYADGQRLDGYAFLDVTRLLYAYDYRRSVVNVEIDNSGKYIASLSAPRALRRDLPADVHVFREAFWRFEVFFSRELARALLEVEPHGFYFEDPATGGQVAF
jgi:hypothetical protein